MRMILRIKVKLAEGVKLNGIEMALIYNIMSDYGTVQILRQDAEGTYKVDKVVCQDANTKCSSPTLLTDGVHTSDIIDGELVERPTLDEDVNRYTIK